MIHSDDGVKERCVKTAEYIVKEEATVRGAALRFGISKSTVHKDLTERLRTYDRRLYEEALQVLKKNKSERHLRGGEATRLKYLLNRCGRNANGGGQIKANK